MWVRKKELALHLQNEQYRNQYMIKAHWSGINNMFANVIASEARQSQQAKPRNDAVLVFMFVVRTV